MTEQNITSLPSTSIKGAAFYIRVNKVNGAARTPSSGHVAFIGGDHPSWDAEVSTHGI